MNVEPSTVHSLRVGIIGAGRMGSSMAHRLLQAGHCVTAYDPSPEAMRRITSIGAATASNPAEVARASDLVVLMVLGTEQAEQAIWGEEGFAQGASRASILTITSSLSPGYVAELGARAVDRFQLVDSPVSGGVEGATAGTLTFMVAGPDDAVHAAAPVYEALGSRVFRLGAKPGLGATMKAINQSMFLTSLVSAAEMIVTAAKAGLSPDLVVEVASQSSGDSWALRHRIPLSWRNGYSSGGSLALMLKDIAAGLELVEEHGVDAQAIRAAARVVREAYDRNRGHGDDPLIVEAIEARSGVRLAAGAPAAKP